MSAVTKRPVGRPPKRIEPIPATAEEIAAAIFRAADEPKSGDKSD